MQQLYTALSFGPSLSLIRKKDKSRCQFRFSSQSCKKISLNIYVRQQTISSKVSKITITFKNELNRKSESELLGFGFGYKFVLYQPSLHGPSANGDARKTRVNIRLGCQVKEWLEFRWDPSERRYKYARSFITSSTYTFRAQRRQ